MPGSTRTPVITTLPTTLVSSSVTTVLTPDVMTSAMLIVTALSGAPHLIANVTSLIQTIATEEPADVTSVMSELASLLNFSMSASAASGLPTLSTIFNGTGVSLHDKTEYDFSHISDIGVIPNEPTLSSVLDDIGGNFTDLNMQDFLDHNFTITDELINSLLSINSSETEEDLLNFTDGHLPTISPYHTGYADMSRNVTVLNTQSATFLVTETDQDPSSSNLSSEQYLDNTSDNFTDNFVSTEAIPPLNFFSVANFSSDGDNESRVLTSVMENEELTSIVITTLETLLAQSKDFASTDKYIEQISQMIQKTTADVTDSTKCYSSQCNTLPTDATASSWESSFAPDALSEKYPTAVTTESTLTWGETHGTFKLRSLCIHATRG